jgi:cyclopropane-fatty-acyl-phospholipid synthase
MEHFMLESVTTNVTTHVLDPLIAKLRAGGDLPLAIQLWNGARFELGAHAHITIHVRDRAALSYLLTPSLESLGEGYVQGALDFEGPIADMIALASSMASRSLEPSGAMGRVLQMFNHHKALDAQSVQHHYDVSNEFYGLWLDENRVYSCAYFPQGDETLAQAQMAKIDHILRKIRLKPGEQLLDIGCGWGALAMRAAQHWGAQVVGITLSQRQFELARERVAQAGLQSRIEIRLQDYRDVTETFDKLTSVGMFEHVGLKHLREYFGQIRARLKDGGLALNHGITSTDPDSGNAPWGAGNFIEKYVFPNGELPHISLALKQAQAAGLEALDVENLRRHYAKTLSMWSENYERATPKIKQLVPEQTYRVWRVYLAGCAHGFAQDWMSIYQILLCKSGPMNQIPTPLSRAYMYEMN